MTDVMMLGLSHRHRNLHYSNCQTAVTFTIYRREVDIVDSKNSKYSKM